MAGGLAKWKCTVLHFAEALTVGRWNADGSCSDVHVLQALPVLCVKPLFEPLCLQVPGKLRQGSKPETDGSPELFGSLNSGWGVSGQKVRKMWDDQTTKTT